MTVVTHTPRAAALPLPVRLVAYLAAVAVLIVLVPLFLGHHPPAAANLAAHLAVVLLAVGVTWLFRRHVDRRPWQGIGLPRPDRRQAALAAAGFALGAALVAVSVAIPLVAGWLDLRGTELADRGVAGEARLLALGLAYYLTSAVVEELAFRGYIFGNLAERMPVWVAALGMGLVFAAAHLIIGVSSPWFAAVAMVDYTAFAMAMVLLRVRTGTLWAAIGLHTAWNWTQDYLLGIGTSSEPDFGNALLHLRLHGPALLVGGPHNADVGLPALLVDALMLAGCWWVSRLPAGRRPASLGQS